MNFYFLLTSSILAVFMSKVDSSIVNISLPAISEYFKIGTGEAARVVFSYLLTVTCSLTLSGKIGDIYGHKKVFLWGYIIFGAASLSCGAAQCVHWLIISRYIQGVGGAIMFAMAFTMVTKQVKTKDYGKAFSALAGASAVGLMIGAPLGGLLTGVLSWRYIFFVNLPVCGYAVWIIRKHIAGDSRARAKKSFDLPGAVLFFAALSFLLFALNFGEEWGWVSLKVLSFFGAFALFGFLFYVREKHFAEPLISLDLYRNKAYTLASVSGFLAFLVIAGNGFILPFYLVFAMGMTVKKAGCTVLAFSLTYLAATFLLARIADKVSQSLLCSAGLAGCALCCVTFAFLLHNLSLAVIIIFLVGTALCLVAAIPPNNAFVMKAAAGYPDQGAVTGAFQTLMSLGAVIGVCVFETVFDMAIGAKRVSCVLGDIPPPVLAAGFKWVYLCAGLLCAAGAVTSARAGKEYRKMLDAGVIPPGKEKENAPIVLEI